MARLDGQLTTDNEQKKTDNGTDIAELQRLFENPPDDCKIMMRWWWFGPAVTESELDREMRLMKDGGIGGFEVQAVYPLALDDASTGIRNLPYLSDEFIGAVRFTAKRAREIGLRMDLTLGSGWPYGGLQVPISQAAGRIRVERVKLDGNQRRVPLPDISAGENLIAVFVARGQDHSISPESFRELNELSDGMVRLPAGLDGPHELFFFISSRTGMQVKRAAVGAEGFVLDHLDRAAVHGYLEKVGDRLSQAFDPTPPYAIFCDSLEVYNQDWTGNFLEEFKKRRGYDLRPHLPALVIDMGSKSAAIRHDWGKTLTELLNEHFVAPLGEWAHRNRTLLRMQDYGVPAAALSSNASVDRPEGEGWQWKRLAASRWASSASHLFGRPVASSEVWTWLHSPVFRATLLDMKAEADLHFLQGINQLVGHGWPYTAEGVEYPGWRFYAAGVFNEKNPWWIVMPDVSRYLQRMSFLLRQGQPANDVALYLPNSDAWAHFSAGNVHLIDTLRELIGPDIVARVQEAGYGFDFFDDQSLAQVGRVEQGALVLGPNRYRVVILPGVERMPLDTLRKLEEFARSGGVLIATRRRPELAPGFLTTEAEQNQVGEISRRLFEGPSATARLVTDENHQLGSTLAGLIRPDLLLSPPRPEIGFIHRRTGEADIYFLANTSNVRQITNATFRVEAPRVEGWNPITGGVRPAEARAEPGGGITIPLDLEPYGSRVFVLSQRALPVPVSRDGPVVQQPIDLSTDWQVAFGQNSVPLRMDRLHSWTEDDDTRQFSGLASYERDVIVPEGMLQDGLEVRLDFGEGQAIPIEPLRSGMRAWLDAPIREAAVVFVNGHRAGSVWCPPFSLNLSSFVRRGENRIRIDVGNLAINHMAGRRLPDYRLLNLRYGERFQPQDMDKVRPVPAGLIGPIRLISARAGG